MNKEFPILAGLLERSMKRKDFWNDRGFFEFDVGETTETCAEASDAVNEKDQDE